METKIKLTKEQVITLTKTTEIEVDLKDYLNSGIESIEYLEDLHESIEWSLGFDKTDFPPGWQVVDEEFWTHINDEDKAWTMWVSLTDGKYTIAKDFPYNEHV